MTVLETLLAEPSGIGANHPDETPGAGWAFLLSSLELERVATLIEADAATRRMLTTLAPEVKIVDARTVEADGLGGFDLVHVPAGSPDREVRRLAAAAKPRRWFFERIEHAPPELRAVGSPVVGRWDGSMLGAAPIDRERPLGTARGRKRVVLPWARRRVSLLVDPEGAGPGSIPAYVAELIGDDRQAWSWTLSTTAQYPSQKGVLLLSRHGSAAAELVVKLPAHPRYSHRLQVEHRMLHLARAVPELDGRVPEPVVLGRSGTRSVLVETAVRGSPLSGTAIRDRQEGSARSQAVALLTAIGRATRSTISGAEAGDAFDAVLDRLESTGPLPAGVSARLRAYVRHVRGADAFPVVLQHGDPGAWNLLQTPGGGIAVLDWEAGEAQGVPLWDLLHLQRSWVLGSRDRWNVRRRLTILERAFLGANAESARLRGEIERYAQALDLDRALLEPLFHLCWAARAAKEAARQRASGVAGGHYRRLTVRMMARPVAALSRVPAASGAKAQRNSGRSR